LSKKPYAIEHVFGPIGHRSQPQLEGGVLLFELRDTLRQVDARWATLGILDVLELGFGYQCTAPESRELVREVTDERIELAEGPLLSSCVV
jgi:hypothetical protein